MSNTLIKSYAVNYSAQDKKTNKRVIDSNQAVSERIKELSEILEQVPEDDFADEFTEGLDAAQVDALLTDQEELAEENARNEAVQKLVDDANEQAQKIIADANAEAERIIADANAETEKIFEEARAKGESEGIDAGYAEGLERAAIKEREAEQKAADLEAQYESKVSELEPKFVETLTGIYSHVLGIDLSGRSDVILHLLQDAIRNTEGSKNFLVHVCADDHDYVNENKDRLIEGLGGSATVEVISDVNLSEGSCYIETESGIFDCSIGTELELLAKELKILSYSQE